ncbi:Origin recognition complex subunit 5 [Mycena sanguinolenta]|uniref:Origin recognition complex subunit 5 n=1 Tax=Mycena sanguinolenta TaxID=230812 RepID=A0A8H6ZEE9_9AGAR|nr:Origin recognition complex subunit 5 [Mycena sanguinolenta]
MALEETGYEKLVQEISSLFSGRAPPFLYINDPVSPRTTAHVVNSVLSSIAHSSDASSRVYHAQINAVACFNPRILYSTVLNQLAGWGVQWAQGSMNWGGERWSENLDGFVHGLKAVHSFIREKFLGSNKGKSKQTNDVTDLGQIVIVVERPERLSEQQVDILVPLTRLAELTQLDLSVILVSDVPWEDMRSPFGASPDPYYVDVLPLNKEALLRRLNAAFNGLSSGFESTTAANPYHPSLRSLYSQYLSVLLDSCSLYVQDPNELQYIAAARWPGFVKPILDAQNFRPDEDVDMDGNDEPALKPPPEDIRMRLIHWTMPPTGRHQMSQSQICLEIHRVKRNRCQTLVARPRSRTSDSLTCLACQKFILVAAYLASTNPHTSDVRMFGRGVDEKKRKRRPRKSTAKGGTTKASTERYVFLARIRSPLDRIIAILGALLEENDVDRRLPAPEYTIPGEQTDMEIARVGVYNAVIELADIGLLHRTSPSDKLDGPPTFKCGISYNTSAALARQLDVTLDDLLWDPA